MNTLGTEATVKDVTFKNGRMTVALNDGRAITVPLDWFPRLAGASEQSLNQWESIAAGHGIHWPELDEDISVEGLLFGNQPTTRAEIRPPHGTN